ncbi:twin-arginine translocase TatA/TatE family subunit [Vibrio profundum]|uniref:twin-arginine translocase TatA/TatE family subunit n=1 Tax=Vibrio profundum TaxID=2910247 RepID=UPI003D11A3C8
MGEISLSKLLVVAVIFVMLFGTKKLRTFGEDLGLAIKGFKKTVSDNDNATSTADNADSENVETTSKQNLY